MSKSKAKGTTAEREVVRYLQQWWPAAERRALSGNKDKGDVAGIPGVCIEIKAAKTQLIGPWKRETLTEMDNAGVGLCLLVVKRPYKPVSEWDAYMPAYQTYLCNDSRAYQGSAQWVRMDLILAVSTIWQIEE
jgi:Holliday junction resolvase